MIIQFSSDQNVLDASRILEAQYPHELVQASGLSLLNASKTQVLTEINGSPIKRLTFISHTGFHSYGLWKPEKLAAEVIERLQEADALSPGFSGHIANLDIVGCHNGYVSPEGQGMSLTIAKILFDAGYHIQIKSFTNMSHSEPHPVYKLTTLIDPDTNTYIIRAYGSKADEQAYEYLQEKHGILVDKKEELEYQLAERVNSQTLLHYENGSDEYKSVLDAEVTQLKSELDEIQDKIKPLESMMQSKSVEIARTPALRHYLDTDPQCNFTTRAIHHLGDNKGIRSELFNAAKNGNATLLREAIQRDKAMINLTNANGLTPVFIAAQRGHLDCVNILIEEGAMVHLAPAIMASDLYDSLTTIEQEDAARLLIEEKYGVVDQNTMVQISPSEIAGIMGYPHIQKLIEEADPETEQRLNIQIGLSLDLLRKIETYSIRPGDKAMSAFIDQKKQEIASTENMSQIIRIKNDLIVTLGRQIENDSTVQKNKDLLRQAYSFTAGLKKTASTIAADMCNIPITERGMGSDKETRLEHAIDSLTQVMEKVQECSLLLTQINRCKLSPDDVAMDEFIEKEMMKMNNAKNIDEITVIEGTLRTTLQAKSVRTVLESRDVEKPQKTSQDEPIICNEAATQSFKQYKDDFRKLMHQSEAAIDTSKDKHAIRGSTMRSA